MAIFHLNYSIVSRRSGRSALDTAAYMSGQKLSDHKTAGKYFDHSDKEGVLHTEMVLPPGTPSWAKDRQIFWQRLEAREDRGPRPKIARVARNFVISLPCELTLEQNILLSRDFVYEFFGRKGYVVDLSVHAPDPRGDLRNVHFHFLLPLRKILGESFGNKDHWSLSHWRRLFTQWRRGWADTANRHLARYRHGARISELSLKAQGIKRAPIRWHSTKHRPAASRQALEALRALQKPLPVTTLIATDQTVREDGSLSVTLRITRSALNSLEPAVRPVRPTSTPALSGWCPDAVVAWETWGRGNPNLFFAIWQELAPIGFSAGKCPEP